MTPTFFYNEGLPLETDAVRGVTIEGLCEHAHPDHILRELGIEKNINRK